MFLFTNKGNFETLNCGRVVQANFANVENRRYPIIWNVMTSNVACSLSQIYQRLFNMDSDVGSILPTVSNWCVGKWYREATM